MKKHKIHYIWAGYIIVTLSISLAYDWSLWLQAGVQGIGAVIYFFWPIKKSKPYKREYMNTPIIEAPVKPGKSSLPHFQHTPPPPEKPPVIHKYIIYDGEIRHGLVEYHSQLIPRPDGQTELVRGGGRICFMPETRELLFYSLSTDFGYASLDNLKEALQRHRWSNRFNGYCVYYSEQHELNQAKIKQSLIHQIS